MQMRYGAPTPTARRLLRLFGLVGALLALSIAALAAAFWIQPTEPPAVGPALAGWGTPVPATAGAVPAGRPVTWTVRMTTNPATGQPEGVVDDPRVYEMVKADYLEDETWLTTSAITLTRSNTATQQLETYFAGQRYYEMMGLLDYFRTQQRAYTTTLQDRRQEVRNFTPDGQEVFVGDSWAGGQAAWYSLDTQKPIEVKELPAGMVIVTMRYDQERGRWREIALRVPEVPVSPTPGAGGEK